MLNGVENSDAYSRDSILFCNHRLQNPQKRKKVSFWHTRKVLKLNVFVEFQLPHFYFFLASDTSIEFTVYTCYKLNDYWRTSEDRLRHASMTCAKTHILDERSVETWTRKRIRKCMSVDTQMTVPVLCIFSLNMHSDSLNSCRSWFQAFSVFWMLRVILKCCA
jgi:hypothetical protein